MSGSASALLGSVDQTLNAQAREVSRSRSRRDRSRRPGFRGWHDCSRSSSTPAGVVLRSSPANLAPLLSRATDAARVVAGQQLRRLDLARPTPAATGGISPCRFAGAARSSSRLARATRRIARPPFARAAHRFATRAPDRVLGGYGSRRGSIAPGRGDATPGRGGVPDVETGRLPVPPARDELSRLATTLNDMLGRLEAAFEHERRFVADASHELRTPLTMLLDGARPRVATASFAGRTRRGCSLSGGGGRTTFKARGGSAVDRSIRPGRLPVRSRAVRGDELVRNRRRSDSRRGRARRGHGVGVDRGRAPPSRPTRHVSSRHSATLSRTRWRTATARSICARDRDVRGVSCDRPWRRLSLGISFSARLTGSAAPTRRGAEAAAGWAFRSSR